MFTNYVAHQELYERAGILYCDISINNLMVDSDHPDIGVLIDLDFAVRDRDPDTGVCFALPLMPGGTVPFCSVDLSTKELLLRSLYRHGLESFFGLSYGYSSISLGILLTRSLLLGVQVHGVRSGFIFDGMHR